MLVKVGKLLPLVSTSGGEKKSTKRGQKCSVVPSCIPCLVGGEEAVFVPDLPVVDL